MIIEGRTDGKRGGMHKGCWEFYRVLHLFLFVFFSLTTHSSSKAWMAAGKATWARSGGSLVRS